MSICSSMFLILGGFFVDFGIIWRSLGHVLGGSQWLGAVLRNSCANWMFSDKGLPNPGPGRTHEFNPANFCIKTIEKETNDEEHITSHKPLRFRILSL